MPEISRFFGIVIAMYHGEHEPPHFHARYGRSRIVVRISDGFVQGDFPTRALSLVLEWWVVNRDALAANWNAARRGTPLSKIAPLE
jgi:uncharacterized protein DUF4160